MRALLAAASLLLAGAAAAIAPDALLFREEVQGSAAYGLRVEAAEYLIDIIGHGNGGAPFDTVAAFIYDADQRLLFGVVFSWNAWAARTVVGLGPGLDAASERMALRTHATDAACPYACLTIYGGPWADSFAVWTGGMARTTLEVWGPEGGVAHVARGTPYVLSDAMLSDGSPNLQAGLLVPPSPLGAPRPVGAKVLLDAVVEVEVEHRLHGLFHASDGKRACTALTGCVAGAELERFCGEATGLDCANVALSWDGPGGGGSGSEAYPFVGGPAGAYAFRIDRAADAWASWLWYAPSGTYVDLFEDHVNLALADVPLP